MYAGLELLRHYKSISIDFVAELTIIISNLKSAIFKKLHK